MATECDIAVVGGGPAGLMTAWHAASKGASVLLLDRKKSIGEPVRCGEGTMLHVLKTFGLDEGKWCVNHIQFFKFFPADTKPVLMRAQKMGGVILDRVAFEQEIARRAMESGAEIVLERVVTKLDGGSVILSNGETVTAKVIVGADGVESVIGRQSGLLKPLLPKDIGTAVTYKVEGDEWEHDTAEVYMGERIIPGGYAWLFPTHRGKANVGIGFLMSDKVRRPGEAVERLNKWCDERLPGSRRSHLISGCVPTSPPIETAVRGNVMLVGDAARHSYAVGGGGIHSALFDGFAAGHAAAAAVRDDDLGMLARYDDAWKSAYLKNLRRSYKMRYRIFDNDKVIRRSARLVRIASPLVTRYPGILWRFWWGKQAEVIERTSKL